MSTSTITQAAEPEVSHQCHVVVDQGHHPYVVQPIGRLDWATCAQLRDVLLAEDNLPSLILDLRSTTTMDSAGLGVVLAAIGRIKGRGDQIVIVASNPAITDVLWAAGANTVVPVVASVADAGRRLGTISPLAAVISFEE